MSDTKKPEDGEWWLCVLGGVSVVFLRKDDEWRGYDNDTYNYSDVAPICKMVKDKTVNANGFSTELMPNLKPRTRTEYEKVTESIFDLKDEFERRVLRHKKSTGVYGVVTSLKMLLAQSENGNLYRKVEKPIEWWEDLAQYAKEINDGSALSYQFDGERLRIHKGMTRDQWCDFARILLEQEGEWWPSY